MTPDLPVTPVVPARPSSDDTVSTGMIAIDARGMRCPWPAIRLVRALRGGAAAVEILADDPGAAHEFAAVAADFGCVLTVTSGDAAAVYRVTGDGGVNRSFTRDG